MKSRKVENLGGGLKRETKTDSNGGSRITTYRPGLLGRNVKSYEKREPPKKR